MHFSLHLKQINQKKEISHGTEIWKQLQLLALVGKHY